MGPTRRIRKKIQIMPIAPPSTNTDDIDRRIFFLVLGLFIIHPKIVLAFKAFAFYLTYIKRKECS